MFNYVHFYALNSWLGLLLHFCFGCAKKFVHKVKLCQDVASVQQKLRRLPFSVRDAVSTELNRLIAAYIIER